MGSKNPLISINLDYLMSNCCFKLDLVIISLGTNEVLTKQSEEQYFAFRPNDSRN